MGNKLNTAVTSGVKEQAAGDTKHMYKFLDLKGGGELVDLMKKANRTKNYKELDERIRDGLKQFLYCEEGKIVHIREVIQARCRERGIVVPKRTNNNDLDVNEMEAMTDDEDFLKKHGEIISIFLMFFNLSNSTL